MTDFNQQFILSLGIIFLGYILKRLNFIREKDGEAISRLIFNVTLPSLIITSFATFHFQINLIAVFIFGLLSGFVYVIAGLLLFKNKPKQMKGMLVMMMPGFNIGLFAFPLVEGLWGQTGITYFGMLDGGNAFIVFGLCYLIGSYYADEDTSFTISIMTKKLAQSIPLMTYLVIFGLKLVAIPIPAIVVNVTGTISQANMPLSLLLLGVYLSFVLEKSQYIELLRFLLARYGIALIIGLSSYFLLPLPEMARLTLLIGAVLPIPLSHIPYAVEFDFDKRFIGTVSSMTIFISFGLIWLFTVFLL